MEKQLAVAKVLNDLYKEEHDGHDMDAFRIQKLMYFLQRESLIKSDEAFFKGQFEGWTYGPVLPYLYKNFRKSNKFENVEDVSEESFAFIKSVYEMYKDESSLRLNRMSHEEFSWQNARVGLDDGASGNKKISLDEIRVDAVREMIRRALGGM